MAEYQRLRPLVERVARTLAEPPVPPFDKILTFEGTLSPGAQRSLHLPSGPAALAGLMVELRGPGFQRAEETLRSTVIAAAFDGEETVWCPAGEFFGTSVGLNELRSWTRTVASDGRLGCRWTMPYRKAAKITALNFGRRPVNLQLRVSIKEWIWDARSMYFHASWRHQFPICTRPFVDWNYLTAAGRGVYVGDTLAVFNPVAVWWGEGDEKVRVDDESFPSHFGTGTEDHYGYAWGSPALFQSPFCNQPRAQPGNIGHTTNTRTRILDAIPFRKKLKYDLEIWHWADCAVAYSVASYWYARPGATSNAGPRPADASAALPRLPEAPAYPGALECEGMEVLGKTGGMTILTQEGYPLADGAWSRGTQILVLAQEAASYLELLVADGIEGPRRVILHGTRSYDYGIIRFWVNGRDTGKELDGYAAQPALSGPIELGTFDPENGKLVLRAQVVGANAASRPPKRFFGLDCVVLEEP
jgi:hypothetical protein